MGQSDEVLESIVDYVFNPISGGQAYAMARWDLMDSIGCALLALNDDGCRRHVAPLVPGMSVRHGCRIPGTTLELDPVHGSFVLGSMIRWLDYNDTWLGVEGAHPSDNLGAIWATTDWVSRTRIALGEAPLYMHDVLSAMIKAHEIQGMLALSNNLKAVGIDHVVFAGIASAAVVAWLMGATRTQVMSAVSNAWVDGGSLRVFRHSPNAGSRKSWASADAVSRSVRLALMALSGEMGYETPLTTPSWGFNDAVMNGREIRVETPLASRVMENIVFKVGYPAEIHGQTAVEAALAIYEQLGPVAAEDALRIDIETHAAALPIIDKSGPLRNPADRDHCLQYMVAAALTEGRLTAKSYSDLHAQSRPGIDQLREKMLVTQDPDFSRGYEDPNQRTMANRVRVNLRDNRSVSMVIHSPLGHPKRRQEALPSLRSKFVHNVGSLYNGEAAQALADVILDSEQLDSLAVPSFVDLFVRGGSD